MDNKMSLLSSPFIPEGMVDLMKKLSKGVIKEKPSNIYEYAAEFFEKMLIERDGSLDKGYGKFRSYTKCCKFMDKMEQRRLNETVKICETNGPTDVPDTSQKQITFPSNIENIEVQGVAIQGVERKSKDNVKNVSINPKYKSQSEKGMKPVVSNARNVKTKPRKLSSKKPSENLIVIKEETSADVDDSGNGEFNLYRAAAVIQKAFRRYFGKKDTQDEPVLERSEKVAKLSEDAAAFVIQKAFKSLIKKMEVNRERSGDESKNDIEAEVVGQEIALIDKFINKNDANSEQILENEHDDNPDLEAKENPLENPFEDTAAALEKEAVTDTSDHIEKEVEFVDGLISNFPNGSEESQGPIALASENIVEIKEDVHVASRQDDEATIILDEGADSNDINTNSVDNVLPNDASLTEFDQSKSAESRIEEIETAENRPGSSTQFEPLHESNKGESVHREIESPEKQSAETKSYFEAIDLEIESSGQSKSEFEILHESQTDEVVDQAIETPEKPPGKSKSESEALIKNPKKGEAVDREMEVSAKPPAQSSEFKVLEESSKYKAEDPEIESPEEPPANDNPEIEVPRESQKEIIGKNVSDDIVFQPNGEANGKTSGETVGELEMQPEQPDTIADNQELHKVNDEFEEAQLTTSANASEESPTDRSIVVNFEESQIQILPSQIEVTAEIGSDENLSTLEADPSTQNVEVNSSKEQTDKEQDDLTESQPKSETQLFTVEKDIIYVNMGLLREKLGPIAIDDGTPSDSEKSFNLNIQEREEILVNQENFQSIQIEPLAAEGDILANTDESPKIAVGKDQEMEIDEMGDSKSDVELKDQGGNEEYELAETVVLVDFPLRTKSNHENKQATPTDDNEYVDVTFEEPVEPEKKIDFFFGNDHKKDDVQQTKSSEAIKTILDNVELDKFEEPHPKDFKEEPKEKQLYKSEQSDPKDNSNEKQWEEGDIKDVEGEPNQNQNEEEIEISNYEEILKKDKVDSQNEYIEQQLNKNSDEPEDRPVEGIVNSDEKQPAERSQEDEIEAEPETKLNVEEQEDVQNEFEQIKTAKEIKKLGKDESSNRLLKSKVNEELVKAATIIQKVFRGYVVRKSAHNQTDRNTNLHLLAALTIQKYVRGYLVRRFMQNFNKFNVVEVTSNLTNDDEKETYVTKENANNGVNPQVPAYSNRFLIPKDSFLERESFADDEDYTRTCKELAATSIQKTYRGYRVRRSLKSSNETDGTTDDVSSDTESKREPVGNDQLETVVNEAELVISDVLSVAADVLPTETYDSDSFENEAVEDKNVDLDVKDYSCNDQLVSDETLLKDESVLGQIVQDKIHIESQMQQKFNQMTFQNNGITPIDEMSDSSEQPETPIEKTNQIDSNAKMSDSIDSSKCDGLKSFSYEALSSDLSDTDENKRGSFKDSEIDETSRDERDDLSEVENFDLSSCGEDSLEAMYYSIRKNEIMLDRMQKQVVEQREPRNDAPENLKVEFPERVTENLDVTMQHVFKSLESSSDCDGGRKDEDDNSSTLHIGLDDSSSINDEKEIETYRQIKQFHETRTKKEEPMGSVESSIKDDEDITQSSETNCASDVLMNNTEQSDSSVKSSTRFIMKSQSVSEDMMNPIMYAIKRKQALLDQLHVRHYPLQENLTEDHDAFPEHLLSDIDNGHIQRKILASSISTDSDYIESNVTTRRLVRDDFNISTALDHLSTDSDSTIISAATKIQAGARGFLTRRRLRRTSAGGTSISFEKRYSFGNAAIDKSLEDLIKKQEQVNLDGAALKIQKQFRRYQARKKNLKKVSPIRELTLELSGESSIEVEGMDDNLGIREITLAQKKVDQQCVKEIEGTHPIQLNIDEVDTMFPVKRTPVNRRRLTLQRGDAVQRNSRPDSQESNIRETNHTSDDNQTDETFKDSEIGECTGTINVQGSNRQEKKVTAYINIQSLINRGIGPRQRSMPVQIDSELIRIIPKHLRKRVKSADMAKRKS